MELTRVCNVKSPQRDPARAGHRGASGVGTVQGMESGLGDMRALGQVVRVL